MSTHAPSHEDAFEAHHGHSHGHGAGHGSMKSYTIGFVLSVILTAIPFWLVMAGVFESPGMTAFLVMALGAIQIVVHMICFLHMNTRSEGGWTMMALIFTIVIVARSRVPPASAFGARSFSKTFNCVDVSMM